MSRLPLIVILLTIALALPACGGGESDSEAENPGKSGPPVTFKDLDDNAKKARDMMKGAGIPAMPGMDNMPNPNDPEAMKKWAEGYKKQIMEGKGDASTTVTEAELKTWYETTVALKNVDTTNDAAAAAALMSKAGPKYALLTIKVAKALSYYQARKANGTPTAYDKKNAAVYEKYIKLKDALNDE